MPDFLDFAALAPAQAQAVLEEAERRKAMRAGLSKGACDLDRPLQDRVLAMIFAMPSTRTRLSFALAIRQLGGDSIAISASDSHLGRGETIEDTGAFISRMADAIMIRAPKHGDIVALAGVSSVPVINGMTGSSHPCQVMACMQTLRERGIDLAAAGLAWVGDGNNVCASYVQAASRFGYRLAVATPAGHAPPADIVAAARCEGADISLFDDPERAVAGADAVITDTFFSMGEERTPERRKMLAPFMVTAALMGRAAPGAFFSHCLPAYRGEEVAAEVIDGPSSIVFDEAENRMHVQKAILLWCFDAMTA